MLTRLVLPDGKLWVDRAVDWQLADVRGALEGDAPYRYSTRGRGGSKTTDCGAASLAWMLSARDGARGYLAASDRDQARLALDSLRGFLDRSPALRERVGVDAWRVSCVNSGASVEVLSSDASSSWGLRPEWLVVDELAWWADTPAAAQFWDSLSSAMAKSETARMWVVTSPSAPSHPAHKLLAEARESALWSTSEITGPIPWLDPARVEEQRRRLSEPQYRRLFLGEWCDGDDQLAAAEDVDACVSHEGPLEPRRGNTYVVGVDLGVRNDRSVATVAHLEGEKVVVDRRAVWRGSRLKPISLGDVEEWIATTARLYNRAQIVCDPWQAIAMIERLRKEAGLKVAEFAFSTASVGRLAATMVELLRSHRLALPDEEDLLDELREVRLVEKSPGQYRIDHERGKHDDQVISLALAAQQLLREPQPGAAFIAASPLEPAALREATAQRFPGRAAPDPFPLRVSKREPPPPERVGDFLIHR